MTKSTKFRLQRLTEDLCSRLRKRELIGSRAVARETIVYLIAAVEFFCEQQTSFEALLESIARIGRDLEEASPKELVIGNVVKRVIKFIKEEYHTAKLASTEPCSNPQSPGRDVEGDFFAHGASATLGRSQSSRSVSEGPSIFDLLGHKGMLSLTSHSESREQGTPQEFTTPSITPAISRASSVLHLRSPSVYDSPGSTASEPDDFSVHAYRLKRVFTEAIGELLDEVDTVHQEIAQQALEHINSSEMILTIGHSRTIETFIKAAAVKRKFTVIVAETAPSFKGRELALALSEASIETILVPDACVFALMSRVSKVIIGAHAVLADGSFFGITGLYKLCPIFLGDDLAQLDDRNPEEILSAGGKQMDLVQVKNPYYDKVPAELVSLFITNAGGHPSSVCYRLLTDLFGA